MKQLTILLPTIIVLIQGQKLLLKKTRNIQKFESQHFESLRSNLLQSRKETETTSSDKIPPRSTLPLLVKGDPPPKIPTVINGSQSSAGDYPFIAALTVQSNTHHYVICGGTLVGKNVVVSAAHCFGAEGVFVGRHNLSNPFESYTYYENVYFVRHPKYGTGVELEFDLMVGRLENGIGGGGNNVGVAQLDTKNYAQTLFQSQESLLTIGWGTTNHLINQPSSVLNEFSSKVVSQAECEASWGVGTITPNFICTKSLTSQICFGDSGGPLIYKINNMTNGSVTSTEFILVGVVSFTDKSCSIGRPGGYTKVYAFREWIEGYLCQWEGLCGGNTAPPPAPTPPVPTPGLPIIPTPTPPSPPSSACVDDPSWNIQGLDCAHFKGRPTKCSKDIGSTPGTNNLTAQQVCCACGANGGPIGPTPNVPTPPSPSSPTNSPNDMSLGTTMSGSKLQAGSMFDIVPKKNLKITNIDIHTAYSGTISTELYTTVGSFVSVKRTETAWTKVLQANVNGRGKNNRTNIPSVNLQINAGVITGMYVTLSGIEQMLMSDSSNPTGALAANNNDLQIFVGMSSRYKFGRNSENILWNGYIGYEISAGTAPNAPTPTPPIVSPPSTGSSEIFTIFEHSRKQAGAMFDIQALSNISLNGMDIHTSFFGSSLVEVWSVAGSFIPNKRNSAVWTKAKESVVSCRGQGQRTTIGSMSPIVIVAGSTRGIYVTMSIEEMLIKDTSVTGAVFKSNNHMKLLVGMSARYQFGRNSENVVWNGYIRYNYGVQAPVPPAQPPSPTPPTVSPPSIPTPPAPQCTNVANWVDSTGQGCAWYAGSTGFDDQVYYQNEMGISRCKVWGNGFKNMGHTAVTACCICGGGSTYSQCKDVTINGQPWVDTDGEGCAVYATGGLGDDDQYYDDGDSYCSYHGGDYANNGYTADTACCVCGGGIRP